MSDIAIELVGLDSLLATLARLGPEAQALLKMELTAAAHRILEVSQARVPVETGRLRDSGFADQAESLGDDVALEVGYTAPYALFVHEGHRIVAWGHDTGRMSAPNKFLEAPALEEIPTVIARATAALRELH